MIAAKCFSKAWLDECRDVVGRVDPGLLEKSIYAFDLLGRLSDAGLPFVFKGGTALLLLLDDFRRLSIDVDIVCPTDPAEVGKVVQKVAQEGPYLSCEPDERDPARLPKRHHYAFEFASVVDTRVPATLRLDVLEDDAHYPEIQRVPLQSRFIVPEAQVEIPTPTVEGLLADKLTAFAPRTVGIPYASFKAGIRIAKQVSDVGELFLHARDGLQVAAAYDRLFAAENGYRGDAFSRDQALEDTIAAAQLLGGVNLRGYAESPESRTLALGVPQVDSHMIGRRYTLDDARIAAARAAHLASVIRHDTMPPDIAALRFDPAALGRLRDAQLAPPLDRLNRLRGFNVEAFHHWLGVQESV
ncbi:MAG: nucleotidyl transferase AbiEii/AbiGii toxin family protein [Lentisphaerae bacterium]|nr:nucleotidyl transferase AbiEii/AbiGii toxin family protein [Lentisphaerota bacterium]